MTFAIVSVDREQLTLLSQLLVTVFPGCTIHQSGDPVRAMQRISYQKPDAVFADAATISNMTDVLRRQAKNIKICILCKQGVQLSEKMTKGYDVLPWPVAEHQVRSALKRMPEGI